MRVEVISSRVHISILFNGIEVGLVLGEAQVEELEHLFAQLLVEAVVQLIDVLLSWICIMELRRLSQLLICSWLSSGLGRICHDNIAKVFF